MNAVDRVARKALEVMGAEGAPTWVYGIAFRAAELGMSKGADLARIARETVAEIEQSGQACPRLKAELAEWPVE